MGMETRDISILIQHLLAFSHHPNNAPSLQTTQLHFQQQQHQHHLTHQKKPLPKPSNANMQFTILAFAAMAAAIPAMIQERAPGSVCPALDTPLCCQADVDGVVDLTCEARKYPPLYLLLESTQTLIFFFLFASFRHLLRQRLQEQLCLERHHSQVLHFAFGMFPLLLRNHFIRRNTLY